MNGRHHPDRPWWEFDPDEIPVPLEADGEWRVDDDAELIVASQRVTIEREDTEPTLATLLAAAREAGKGAPSRHTATRSMLGGRAGLVLLVAGCVAMFLHGWSYRSAASVPVERSGERARITERERDVDPATSTEHPSGSLRDQSDSTARESAKRRR